MHIYPNNYEYIHTYMYHVSSFMCEQYNIKPEILHSQLDDGVCKTETTRKESIIHSKLIYK